MCKVFLLDTCVLSYLRIQEKQQTIKSFILECELIYVSVATVHEIARGAAAVQFRDHTKYLKIHDFYSKLYMSEGFNIVDTDWNVAHVWGTLSAQPELKHMLLHKDSSGQLQQGQDLHIAAAAIAKNLPIASNNIRDFKLIHEFAPLPGLYDPLNSKWHIPPDQSVGAATIALAHQEG